MNCAVTRCSDDPGHGLVRTDIPAALSHAGEVARVAAVTGAARRRAALSRRAREHAPSTGGRREFPSDAMTPQPPGLCGVGPEARS